MKKTKVETLPFPVDYDELNARIQEKVVTAITVDTTVFDDAGMRLDRGLFSQLMQFGRHPATLVISEVVLKEINRHLVGSLNVKRRGLDEI